MEAIVGREDAGARPSTRSRLRVDDEDWVEVILRASLSRPPDAEPEVEIDSELGRVDVGGRAMAGEEVEADSAALLDVKRLWKSSSLAAVLLAKVDGT